MVIIFSFALLFSSRRFRPFFIFTEFKFQIVRDGLPFCRLVIKNDKCNYSYGNTFYVKLRRILEERGASFVM